MFYCGQTLMTGEGIECDKEKGSYFVKMSVDKGFSIVIHFYGYMHEMGFGIEKNVKN